MKKRIDWIDITKGIGIFLVMLGHTGLPEVFRAWIYSFHMPMFFLISGYLFKIRTQKECIKRSINLLIIPYLAYSMLFILIDFILFNNSHEVLNGLVNTFIGKGSFSVLWFFIALFWVEIFFNYIMKRFDKRKSVKLIVMITLIGYIFSIIQFSNYNLYYLNTASVSISFFTIGYFIKNNNINFYNYFSKKIMLIIFCVLNLISFYINYKIFNRRIDLSDAFFGFILLTYISSLTGTYITMYISYRLRAKKNMSYIKYIGKNTLWYFPLSAYIPKRIVSVLEVNYQIKVSFKGKIIVIMISLVIIAFLLEACKRITRRSIRTSQAHSSSTEHK